MHSIKLTYKYNLKQKSKIGYIPHLQNEIENVLNDLNYLKIWPDK